MNLKSKYNIGDDVYTISKTNNGYSVLREKIREIRVDSDIKYVTGKYDRPYNSVYFERNVFLIDDTKNLCNRLVELLNDIEID